MRIILASKSPRRKELLDELNLDYEIIVSNEEEKFDQTLSIKEQVKSVAKQKAKHVFDNTQGNRVVIGADTIVVKNNEIFGKPKDKKDAIDMLNKLKDSRHTVYTALCVLCENNGNMKEYTDVDLTDVYFRNISDEDILAWVDSGMGMDKAGSYAIQGGFAIHVDRINGNYTTVMGLPIHKLYDILKDIYQEYNTNS